MSITSATAPEDFNLNYFSRPNSSFSESIESARDVVSPCQIHADLSAIETIPSVERNALFSSKIFQIGFAIVIIFAVIASIVIPIATIYTKTSAGIITNSSHHSIIFTSGTTLITTSETTTTTTTSTSITTTTSTSTSSTTTDSISTITSITTTSSTTSETSTTTTTTTSTITSTTTTSSTTSETSTTTSSTTSETSTTTSSTTSETSTTTSSTTSETSTTTSTTTTSSIISETSTTTSSASTSSTTSLTTTTRTTITTPTRTTTTTTKTTTTTSTKTTATTTTTKTTTTTTTIKTTTKTTTTTTTKTTTSTTTTKTTTTTTTKTTSTTTITSSTTSTTTTTVTSSTISATTTTTTTTSVAQSSSSWLFDNNFADSSSIYNGVGVNSPTFQTPAIDGYSSALSVNRTLGQYVNVPTYRNLTYTSFTVELWFYSTSLSSADYGFFGQCQSPTTDHSLYYLIRNYTLYMGFYNDDLTGITTLQTDMWYHAAFVYDYPSSTQKIYLNGQLERSRSSSPYQGTSGAIVIGKTEQVPGTSNYFSGYIDRVSLVMQTKNATEILDDATLVTWNAFDGSYSDSGPLDLNVTANSLSFVSGRVNQAISFTSNSSYYQLLGFVLLGLSNYPYSIAFWVRPSSLRGSVLVHASTTRSGQGLCVDLIGFSSSGQIIITSWGSSNQQVIGPIIPVNVWTHVAETYSTTNGNRLYINGTLNGTTGSMTYVAPNSVYILTLGNSIDGNVNGTCRSQSIVPNVYSGSMDEFRVYSRELNATDIYALANP